jgi:membrane protein required for colicin V production
LESIEFINFDVILLSIILLSGLIAFFRGFIQESLSLALWVFAFAATMFLDEYLDPYISVYITNEEIKRIASLVIIFAGIIFSGGFLIKIIKNLIHWSGMGGLDRLLGVVFGCLRGAILIVVIYLIMPLDIKQSEFIHQSKSGPLLEKFAPEAEKFFKDMISNKNSVMLDPKITSVSKT